MKKKSLPTVEIRLLQAGRLHGCLTETTAASLPQAVPATSDRYHKIVNFRPGRILPLYVLTRGSTLFVGSTKQAEGLQSISLPGGPYACITIRPKYGLFWAKSIAETKSWFLHEWLPASKYRPIGLEFELHSERTVGKNPTLDLFFALEKIPE